MWDFDGVLNVNPGGEVFPWIADLDRDVGIPPESFRRFLNVPGQRRDVLNGWCDLRERLGGWIEAEGHDITAEEFLAHWLTADDRPDAEAVEWLRESDGRKVIATNNAVSRARYIAERTEAGRAAAKVFASGEMGVAKPSPGFFGQIERWAGLPPPRILLIDDSADNCASARRRGWQAFRFGPETRDRLPRMLGL
ncbi:putative hydrolase of the HAD superfamily [Palleronia marisminoris]|uniref:Haloacid dehalogenase-like hydrolase n=1 Tax=Palleronia marisminoris TaxID=315423 RepID=A0A1Y5SJC7_9RHOB|nr:HAD-IA family hydrolase [Palleronia marisminoris]SFG84865.1 putative hydrolase of the HAD superfamily [Palleronia marisminoris]SLN42150.1 haloacid dehalogenase-like hydrolase [Palleronia marisminoris]